MNTKQLVEKAEQIGKEAFHAGKMAVPAHDIVIMDFVRQNASDVTKLTLATKLYKGWSKGWHRANANSMDF